eukprot:TRINITY_DN4146_c0_g1_i1.p1 TRINITY_DN4146_c0_g1~~TRINITY_DN4146_c0_g1_i1.p1  ORF type:complete len:832 (-),score=114.46 TRINITY_DN4146_c0_g1_i1:85-2580(-)
MAGDGVQHDRTEWHELAHINASCVFAVMLVAGTAWNIIGQMSGQNGAEISSLATTFSVLGTIGVGIFGIVLARLQFPGFGLDTSTFGLSALSCVFSCTSVMVMEEHALQQLDLLVLSLAYKAFPVFFSWGKLYSFVWAGFAIIVSVSVQLMTFPINRSPTSSVYIAIDIGVAIVMLFVSFLRHRASMAMYKSLRMEIGERDTFETATSLAYDGVAWVSVDDKQDIVIKRLSPDLDLLLGCHEHEQQERMHHFRSYFKDAESYTKLTDAMKEVQKAPLLHPTQLQNAWGDTLHVELLLIPHQVIDASAFSADGYMIAFRVYKQATLPVRIQTPADGISPPQTPVHSPVWPDGLPNSLNSASASPVSVVSQAGAQVALHATALPAAPSDYQRARGPSVIEVEILGRPANQTLIPQISSPSAQLVTPEARPESGHGLNEFEQSCSCFSSEAVLDLTQLIQLGEREHWLIGCNEVELQPQDILGKGGFGVVVEATFYGARLAAKIAKEVDMVDLSNINMTSSSIIRELRMLRHVRHPNIVLFYGACIEPGSREIVLLFEKIQAPTLSSFVRDEYKERRKDSSACLKSDRKLVKVLIDVCRALHYLHSRSPPLIHADLKPANIFVTSEEAIEPHAMLTDFGLAMQVVATSCTKGFTTRWAAPEVLSSNSQASSTAADVFSFGRLMTYVITGEPPLPSLSQHDIALTVKSGSRLPFPVWPRNILAKACSKIADMCLEFLPVKRPSTLMLQKMLECLPEVIAGASASRSHLYLNAGDTASSQQSDLMDVIPLMPGSMGEEVASHEEAFAPKRKSRKGAQNWIRALQQAREAAACDELL